MVLYNISSANTEPFVTYLRNAESLIEVIQVGAASFCIMSKLVTGTNGDNLMGSLVDCVQEPWAKGKRFPNPNSKSDKAYQTFCNLSLMQAMSSFDHFTAQLAQTLTVFSKKVQTTGYFKHSHKSILRHASNKMTPNCCESKIESFCRKYSMAKRIEAFRSELALQHKDNDELLPIFHYFRLLRNSMAHASGLPSEEFLQYLKKPDYQNGLKYHCCPVDFNFA